MNYRELYATLSQAELRNVATRARLPVDDVRQEAWLWCWQVASGRSDYDARLGTVRRYVMAKLWGLAARESELPCIPWIEAYEEDSDIAHRFHAAEARLASVSVLDELVGREEWEETDQQVQSARLELQHRYAELSNASILMEQGISSVRIAALIGATPQGVRQRVARERTRIARNAGPLGRT